MRSEARGFGQSELTFTLRLNTAFRRFPQARFRTVSRLFPVRGTLKGGVPRFHDISRAAALETRPDLFPRKPVRFGLIDLCKCC